MTYITTTLSAIRAKSPCEDGYRRLVTSLGGARKFGSKTPFPLTTVLDSNGIDDTLWVACEVCGIDGERVARTFAVDCAEHVLHIYEKHVPGDDRVRNALVAKRRWLRGDATDDELVAAQYAARDAANAANAAASAARAASWDAVRDARAAAWDAAWAAARVAARDAMDAWDAGAAASAAAWAARDAMAARAAEIAWQTERLRELLAASDNEVTK